MNNPALSSQLKKTAAGRAILATLAENKNSPLMGKGKIKKFFKKVGKYTSKVTGSIAKVAAGMVGIPPSAIDALAKADPTAHKSLVSKLLNSKAGARAAAVVSPGAGTPGENTVNALSKIKPAYLVAGAGALAAVVFLVSAKGKR